MNALETTCEGCHKRIRANTLEVFQERARRHVRNCAAVRSLAAELVPASPVARLGRSLVQGAKGAVQRAAVGFVLARNRK